MGQLQEPPLPSISVAWNWCCRFTVFNIDCWGRGCPRVLKNSVWIDESVMDYLRNTFIPSLTGNCEVYYVFPGSEMILLGTRRNMMQMVSVYFLLP